MSDNEKKLAGEAAAELVADGMTLGLGTGSTVEHFLRALGGRVAAGMSLRGVPTSERTAALCRELGVGLTDFAEVDALDLAVDGADEIDPAFNMIKGGGGALLREKIVASAARRVAIIVDASKSVDTLGAFPLPVEVVPFGHQRLLRRFEAEGFAPALRMDGEAPAVTDNGNYVIDCRMEAIPEPRALHARLIDLPGVVETGLFIDLCHVLIVGRGDTAEVREKGA